MKIEEEVSWQTKLGLPLHNLVKKLLVELIVLITHVDRTS